MTTGTKKRCANYARISYYDRDSDSLKSQLEQCRGYAEKNGYQIVAELTEDDRGASGADFDLPALNRALDLARHDQIDVLITREMDRFARGLAKQLITERKFNQAGVDVLYVLGEYDDSPEGQLTKHVRAIIAEYEREKISERMERGRHRSARTGNVFVAQNPPFGYRLVESIDERGRVTRTLEIVEEEAIWVRKIYHWYVFGDAEHATLPLSDHKIAWRLTELRVPTKWDRTGRNPGRPIHSTGRWSVSNVRRILVSSTYAGEWTYKIKGEPITVPVPAIIGKTLFERAQRKRRSAHIRSPRNARYDYLLRGRAMCADCGYQIYSQASRHKRNGQTFVYLYYRCPGASNRFDMAHRCHSSSYSVPKTDVVVWDTLKAAIVDPDHLDQALKRGRDAKTLQNLQDQLQLVEKQIAESKAKYARLLGLALEGEYTQDAFQQWQKRLQGDIARHVATRDDIQMRISDTAAYIDRIQAIQDLAAEMRLAFTVADKDFAKRRQLIEIFDVSVRLETVRNGEQVDKLAHIEVDGEHLETVKIPGR